MLRIASVLLTVCLLCYCEAQEYSEGQRLEKWLDVCPNIFPKVFVGFGPKGNETAGTYEKKDDIHNFRECLSLCCEDEKCNVVFMYESTCFLIECLSNDLCTPIYRPEPKFRDITMVLVSPVPPEQSWADVLQHDDEMMSENTETDAYSLTDHACIVGGDGNCPEHEFCQQSSLAVRQQYGVCHCKFGYQRNATGVCQRIIEPVQKINGTSSPMNTLVVSVLSKTVQLPEDGVTLSAFSVPGERPGEHYIYNWKLLTQPEDTEGASGTIKDGMNSATLKLNHLIEGLYSFKVTVTAPDGSVGETMANVTVLAPKRINQPPVAVITPSAQTVKLPNTGAVLDGSTSHDDDAIISWHWELQNGPLGYQAVLENTPTLQLNNLTPGNYTFKLTVEDSDHATNSSTANVTVVKVTDYPPEANAGQDVIVYLPRNNVTLNGNLSTDDRGIALWEWTKSPSDQDKAVDMQKTRTPYLELSNLEEGMYTFTLKVTDDNGQSSSSDVHVFVKPPTNKPPIAVAGKPVDIYLPKTWVLLDGSASSDDVKVASFNWRQLSGPSPVSFHPQNASQSNATGLTKGRYTFQLTVTDSDGNMAVDSVQVSVYQNENAAPKANAGDDRTIVLPVSMLILNGSASSDDLGITKWQWFLDDTSRALGRFLGNSETTPVLMMTGLVEGRYVFHLRVFDSQGFWDDDIVSVIVKPDPNAHHLVELTLNIESGSFTVVQQRSLMDKMKILLRDLPINVRELREEPGTGRTVMVFTVGQPPNELSGPEVVSLLKSKLRQDSSLLELSVVNVQTSVCQNNCSAHGICDQATRACLCEAFWMQNFIRKYLGDGESNCDWSILYVGVVLFVGILFLSGCTWGIICLIRASCLRPQPRQRYSLIDDGDDNVLRGVRSKSVMLSESDSDSDVLFNRRDKGSHNRRTKNGFLGRRVKT